MVRYHSLGFERLGRYVAVHAMRQGCIYIPCGIREINFQTSEARSSSPMDPSEPYIVPPAARWPITVPEDQSKRTQCTKAFPLRGFHSTKPGVGVHTHLSHDIPRSQENHLICLIGRLGVRITQGSGSLVQPAPSHHRISTVFYHECDACQGSGGGFWDRQSWGQIWYRGRIVMGGGDNWGGR